MNERIQQLAEQAGVGFMFDPDAVVLTFKMEKFAELIVRECNRIITNNGIATSEHDQCVRKDCVNEILDNFDIND